MNVYRSGDTAPLIPKLGTSPGCFTTAEQHSGNHWITVWKDSSTGLNAMANKLSLQPGNEPRTSRPQTSQYPDWSIRCFIVLYFKSTGVSWNWTWDNLYHLILRLNKSISLMCFKMQSLWCHRWQWRWYMDEWGYGERGTSQTHIQSRDEGREKVINWCTCHVVCRATDYCALGTCW